MEDKRYELNTNFEMASERRCITLFKSLLSRLPDFMKAIAPEGFENSIYHRAYHLCDLDQAYLSYRTDRAKRYKWRKVWLQVADHDPKITKAEFAKDYVEAPIDLEKEALALCCEGIKNIFMRHSLVYDRKQRCYMQYGNFPQCLIKTVRQLRPEWTELNQYDLYDRKKYIDKVNFSPVYHFLFSLLKEKELDYYYQRLPSSMFANLKTKLDSMLAEVEINKILKKPSEGYVTEEQMEETIVEENKAADLLYYEQTLKAADLDPVIFAYFQVYGQLPENFLDYQEPPNSLKKK